MPSLDLFECASVLLEQLVPKTDQLFVPAAQFKFTHVVEVLFIHFYLRVRTLEALQQVLE